MPTVADLMGHSVETLRQVFQSLLSTEPWLYDADVLPIPYREEKELADVGELPAFGFLADDGIVTPHPPIARALSTIKSAIEYAGYELLDWKPPSNNESMEIHVSLVRSRGPVES